MASAEHPAEILKAAKKLIRLEKNWCPAGWGSGHKRCVVHAIASASTSASVSDLGPINIFARAVRTDSIGRWNDKVGRTHKQVLAAFDKAIALAEKAATP